MDHRLVQQKSFEFALSIIRLYKKLQARQEFIFSSQLLRSGTSIGVNVEEATIEPYPVAAHQPDQQSDYKLDVSSMLVAAKDARETRYWLQLLQESHLVDIDVSNELSQLHELINLLNQALQ